MRAGAGSKANRVILVSDMSDLVTVFESADPALFAMARAALDGAESATSRKAKASQLRSEVSQE